MPAARAPPHGASTALEQVGLAGPRAPHARASCPAASSSASPSRAPSSPSPRCCSPTSRPATSTRATSHEIMELLAELNATRGITVVMVTHEPDMAAYAQPHHPLPRRPRSTADEPQSSRPRDAARDASSWPLRAIRAQHAALVPDRARHRHRRRRRHRHGDLGNGATAKVTADLAKLGTNLLIVTPGQSGRAAPAPTAEARSTPRDVDAIARRSSTASRGGAAGAASRRPSSTAPRTARTQSPAPTTPTSSRRLGARDRAPVHRHRGARRARGLHHRRDGAPAAVRARRSLGRSIRVNKVSCEVIGLLGAKGQTSFGPDQDDIVLMPLGPSSAASPATPTSPRSSSSADDGDRHRARCRPTSSGCCASAAASRRRATTISPSRDMQQIAADADRR